MTQSTIPSIYQNQSIGICHNSTVANFDFVPNFFHDRGPVGVIEARLPGLALLQTHSRAPAGPKRSE
jgi:hypothetical protein